jgi:hypothetical protein
MEKTILILQNDNLIRTSTDKQIKDIRIFDFKYGMSKALKYDIIIYISASGDTVVLKNRYGDIGVVNQPIEYTETTFEKFLNILKKWKK